MTKKRKSAKRKSPLRKPKKRKLAPSNLAVGEALFDAGVRFAGDAPAPDAIAAPKAVSMLRDTTIWIVYARPSGGGALVSHYALWVLYEDGHVELQDAEEGGGVVVCETTGNFIGIFPRAGTLSDVKTAEAQAYKHFEAEFERYYAEHP